MVLQNHMANNDTSEDTFRTQSPERLIIFLKYNIAYYQPMANRDVILVLSMGEKCHQNRSTSILSPFGSHLQNLGRILVYFIIRKSYVAFYMCS